MDNSEIIKKQNQKQDLQYLLNSKSLWASPWLKLTSLMIRNKGNTFWKTNIYSEKIDIIKGFKDLYQHNNSKQKIYYNKILMLLIQDLQYLAGNPQLFSNLPSLFAPKSNAKDINGLSQKIIMKLIKNNTNNIEETARTF